MIKRMYVSEYECDRCGKKKVDQSELHVDNMAHVAPNGWIEIGHGMSVPWLFCPECAKEFEGWKNGGRTH